MAFPPDILLPPNAKYFGFVDPKYAYNAHWDINWSFTYSLVGTEHLICTFLTTSPQLSASFPGQYGGYMGANYASFLLTESGDYVVTEDNERILLEGSSLSSGEFPGILAIAFDSTGLFALSSNNNPGVGLSQIHKNALVIRDNRNEVIFNAPLSALSNEFYLASSIKAPKTLRFRYANGNKISIDYKIGTNDFILLTAVESRFELEYYDNVYAGWSYTSPVSSASIQPSTLYLKNFHTQGNLNPPSTEETSFSPLTSNKINQYTTLSGVSAYRVYR